MADTVDEYLARAPEQQRKALTQLRRAILSAAPDAEEVIRSRVPAFRRHGKPLVSIGAARRHVSLFVMYGSVLKEHADELEAYDTSNTVVRFDPARPIPVRVVQKLVRARAAEIDVSLGRSRRRRGSPPYAVDARVDAYIDALPAWQGDLCRRLRDLIHAADPEIVETIKFRDRPYFVLEGNVCALLAAKEHVNLFLYDGALVPDPEGIVTGGHENTTARTIAVREGESVNEPALTEMLRQIVANNRAGGWRRLKQAGVADD